MHHSLHDAYKFKAKFSEIVLLAASVIFLSTTFASSELYLLLGLQPDTAKLFLGITSVIAFIGSLTLLLLKWPEKAAQHKESAELWGVALNKYRNTRLEDGAWPEDIITELNEEYFNASCDSIDIPDKVFSFLKVEYLAKVEISKLASRYPGAPYFILWTIVKVIGSYRALLQK